MKYTFIAALFLLTSCRKYLDNNPDSTQNVPTTIEGFRQMLAANILTQNSTPGLGVLAANDYWLSASNWQAANTVIQGAYLWDAEIYQTSLINPSWSGPYNAISRVCNLALNGMDNMPKANRYPIDQYNALYGSALFYRAFHFYNLEETYGQLYWQGKSGTSTGIVLRLNANLLEYPGRTSADSVYQQIITDLHTAVRLLPPGVQATHNWPGQPAAWALLAKVYMTLRNYTQAAGYADSCLQQYSNLLDYQAIKVVPLRAFPDSSNPEILFQCSSTDYASLSMKQMIVDSNLYNSYDDSDCRKTLFFQKLSSGKGYCFDGSYTGNIYFFSGIACDEVFLLRAEARIRCGNISGGLSDLSTLLMHRYRGQPFPPYTNSDSLTALRLVMQEKRKETLFRETRWFDLRRWNGDIPGDTLQRMMNNTLYTLAPGGHGYTFQIPQSEILAGGIEQNPEN